MRTRTIASSFLMFILIFMSAGARDASAFRRGPLQVNPYLEFKTVHDDNIYVQNTKPIGDWYFVISPGIAMKLGKPESNVIDMEYRADIYRYTSEHINNTVDHFLNASGKIDFSGGLELSAKDSFASAHEPRSQANAALTGTSLSKYISNDLAVDANYVFNEKFKLGVGYTNYYANYLQSGSDFRDRTDNGVNMTVYYKFMPKTSLLAEGIYKRIYHGNNIPVASATLNSTEYWAMTGLTWDISAKSTGTLKIGYEWKDFDYAGRKTFTSPIYQITLDHRFTPKTELFISGTRQANETDDPNSYYYSTTNGFVRLSVKPVKKFTISPYASYAFNVYGGEAESVAPDGDTEKRSDTFWYTGIELKYEFMKDHLAIAGDYMHSKRSSTITFYDYTDNTFMLSIKGKI